MAQRIGDGGETGTAVMLRPRRILVVDDDAIVGHSINRVLSGQGYQVREALSGAEALEELDHGQYDLVFTDIRMGGMDGLEVTLRVKQRHPEVPVVVITGFATEAGERRAQELGASAFLRKPLTPQMIIENAALALRERSETMEAIRQSALNLMTPAAGMALEPAAAVAAPAGAGVARNVALFFAAPFIGLAYIVAFPFIGIWAVVRYGWRALAARVKESGSLGRP